MKNRGHHARFCTKWIAINSNYTTRKVFLGNPNNQKWELQFHQNVIACIEMLEQLNKIDIYKDKIIWSSSQSTCFNLSSWKEETWKKIQAWTGIEPMTSATLVKKSWVRFFFRFLLFNCLSWNAFTAMIFI